MMLERGWTRPRPTRAQRRADAGIGVAAAVVSVLAAELWHSTTGASLGVGGVEAYVLFALAGLLLVARRVAPLSVLVLESALFIVIGERLAELGASFGVQMIMFASLYAAWAWSRRPRLLYAATALVLVAMFAWLVMALLEPGALPPGSYGLVDADVAAFAYSVLINIVYFGGAIAWGQNAWSSARRRAELDAQSDRERRRQDDERERAIRDERVRIARDLHDVVAHHVSSIGVQAAGAARVLERDPAAARGALEVIETSSRRAVAQMHQLVGLLRGPEGDDADGARGTRTPQPGLADIAGLAGGTPDVEHRVVGEPFAVPGTVALSLFRVAQEAVTNARRHAGARHVGLVVRYLDDAVEVEVTDDGRGAREAVDAATRSSSTGGFGLTGIRERAAMHHGEAEIGPRPQGGFRVRVRVPVPEGADA